MEDLNKKNKSSGTSSLLYKKEVAKMSLPFTSKREI